jgi:hypothetical protein
MEMLGRLIGKPTQTSIFTFRLLEDVTKDKHHAREQLQHNRLTDEDPGM